MESLSLKPSMLYKWFILTIIFQESSCGLKFWTKSNCKDISNEEYEVQNFNTSQEQRMHWTIRDNRYFMTRIIIERRIKGERGKKKRKKKRKD